MNTKLNSIFSSLLKSVFTQFQKVQSFGIASSILFHLIGFFCGNVVSTWLSLFFEWNGIAAIVVLSVLEVFSILEYNFSNQNLWFIRYLTFFKRGLFFGLLSDGFKVGS